MVAFTLRQHVSPSFRPEPASIAAFAAAAVIAAALLLVPARLLEAAVVASGLPALIPAAEPPLGHTARLALAIVGGTGGGAATWFAIAALLAGPLPRLRPLAGTQPLLAPILRRADAHPDAPARAPLRAARDLGAPFLDARGPAERDLPRDLDAPLSAYDPGAIRPAPASPVPLVTPLVRAAPPLEDGERLEVFELPAPIATARTEATVHALLDRLEAGMGRTPRATRARPDGTLDELRRLAARG